MNIKRIFGSILTILGIAGLIYGAVLFVNTSGGLRDVKALIIYGGPRFCFSYVRDWSGANHQGRSVEPDRLHYLVG